MLAPLRRCVDGWPCMVGDLRGRKMRTGSKIENPSTSSCEESRELPFLLFNFLSNLNRAAYKWCAKKWVTSPGPPPYPPLPSCVIARAKTQERRGGGSLRLLSFPDCAHLSRVSQPTQ